MTSEADLGTRDPASDSDGWVTVVAAADRRTAADDRPLSLRRLVLQLSIAAAVLAIVVALAGSALSRRIAENQAVHDVAETTDILADSVLQPSLTEQMATDPTAASALDELIRTRVLSSSLVRVKLWTAQGLILYSDEPQLVGKTFSLDDEGQTAFSTPQTQAEVTDLSRPENAFERSQGKLLEVYRPVWTPQGRELLFETYFRYDVVSQRSSQLWRGFVGITVSSVALLFVLLVPIMWTLLRRARRAQLQREALMQRSLDASADERQRIAAALHDGIVQELAAASFAVAGGAEAAAGRGEAELAEHLRTAAATVRNSLGGLRSLVVDIYPPTLRMAGLPAALRDMAATLAGRGPQVQFEVDDAAVTRLTLAQQQAVLRIAQECLRNTVKHARASHALIAVGAEDGGVTLLVSDDGIGFEAGSARPENLGLSLMTEVAAGIGAQLELRTAPGEGTSWRLRMLT
jgi:signal transduction histidine kinase